MIDIAPLRIMLGYVPFLSPLPVWDYWYMLLVPLCLAVAIVYKAVRVDSMSKLPKEAVMITFWIIGGMALAAGALAVIVRVLWIISLSCAAALE